MIFDIGSYQFDINTTLGSKGVKFSYTQVSPWPKSDCLKIGFFNSDEDGSVISGGDWIDRNGKTINTLAIIRTWPGEALKDINGNYICVPMDQQTKQLVIPDTGIIPVNAVVLSPKQVLDAPDNVYSFIRKEVKAVIASVYVKVLQVIDVNFSIELI